MMKGKSMLFNRYNYDIADMLVLFGIFSSDSRQISHQKRHD